MFTADGWYDTWDRGWFDEPGIALHRSRQRPHQPPGPTSSGRGRIGPGRHARRAAQLRGRAAPSGARRGRRSRCRARHGAELSAEPPLSTPAPTSRVQGADSHRDPRQSEDRCCPLANSTARAGQVVDDGRASRAEENDGFRGLRLSDDERTELLAVQTECTVGRLNSDGWPVSAFLTYAFERERLGDDRSATVPRRRLIADPEAQSQFPAQVRSRPWPDDQCPDIAVVHDDASTANG